MKSTGNVAASSAHCTPLRSLLSGGLTKEKVEGGGDEEMKACFVKLMQLVPTVPSNSRLSKVQLLQHVIDYILDLETTLQFQPELMENCEEEQETDWRGEGEQAGEDEEATMHRVPVVDTIIDRRPLTECLTQINIDHEPQVRSQYTISVVYYVASNSD